MTVTLPTGKIFACRPAQGSKMCEAIQAAVKEILPSFVSQLSLSPLLFLPRGAFQIESLSFCSLSCVSVQSTTRHVRLKVCISRPPPKVLLFWHLSRCRPPPGPLSVICPKRSLGLLSSSNLLLLSLSSRLDFQSSSLSAALDKLHVRARKRKGTFDTDFLAESAREGGKSRLYRVKV